MRYIVALPIAGVLAGLATAAAVAGTSPKPQVKLLTAPEDPLQKTVLIGRSHTGDMLIQFELERAKPMWMTMDGGWGEHALAAGELYHVEVKPIDPSSGTRISYAEVSFRTVNLESGKVTKGALHAMWGGSGLHYATNSGLSGDGAYETTIVVGAPTFARDLKDKGRWMEPSVASFHFKLADGKLIEVSEPVAEVGAR